MEYVDKNVETDMEQYNMALANRINKENLEYWKANQQNFSQEAEEVIKKAQEGKKLSELDVFILTCPEQEKIDEYRKFYNIRESIKDGTVIKEDLHFLIDTLCGEDKNTADQMKSRFSYLINENDKEK